MRGLTIIVAGADAERLHAALSFAAASAATGAATRVHLHARAVGLLGAPMAADADHAAHGLPTLAQIVDDALALGVAISVCQSGLALAALTADALDPRLSVDGPVGVLTAAGDDRLLVF